MLQRSKACNLSTEFFQLILVEGELLKLRQLTEDLQLLESALVRLLKVEELGLLQILELAYVYVLCIRKIILAENEVINSAESSDNLEESLPG